MDNRSSGRRDFLRQITALGAGLPAVLPHLKLDALAASGLLVVAIDLTLAPEAPYPASVQDANYGVRWLKSKAASWNGDASKLGVYGSSSGGHVAELLAMRPRDPRYNAIPLPAGTPAVDATVAYVAMRSPVSNP